MAQKNKMLKMESIGRMAVSLCVCVCAVVRMYTLLPCAASLANNIYVYSGGENQMTQNIRRAPRRSTQVFVVVYSFMVFIDCGDEKQKEKNKCPYRTGSLCHRCQTQSTATHCTTLDT